MGEGAKAKLSMAVYNDTRFLGISCLVFRFFFFKKKISTASINVMDYSLLVGINDNTHELYIGIIGKAMGSGQFQFA